MEELEDFHANEDEITVYEGEEQVGDTSQVEPRDASIPDHNTFDERAPPGLIFNIQ